MACTVRHRPLWEMLQPRFRHFCLHRPHLPIGTKPHPNPPKQRWMRPLPRLPLGVRMLSLPPCAKQCPKARLPRLTAARIVFSYRRCGNHTRLAPCCNHRVFAPWAALCLWRRATNWPRLTRRSLRLWVMRGWKWAWANWQHCVILACR